MARLLTCPKCRALLDPRQKTCPYCGTDQRPVKARQMDEMGATTHFASWIIGLNVAMYALTVVLDPVGHDSALALSPSTESTTMFGCIHRELMYGCGQYWRLVTAIFLHANLIHLGFNSVALMFVAPIAARTFGVHRTVCLYLGTGVLASCASLLWSGYSLGASGAICGLIAALAVYGRRRGGFQGQMLARQMMGWIVFILAFGFIMPNIDNVGHAAGFVGGAALGYLGSGPRAIGGRVDRIWARSAWVLAVGAILVAAIWMVPNVAYWLQARDAAYFQDSARHTLETIGDVSAGTADAAKLPEHAPEGPWGAGAVEEAIGGALAAARSDPRSAETGSALKAAWKAYFAWHGRRKCLYGIGRTHK